MLEWQEEQFEQYCQRIAPSSMRAPSTQRLASTALLCRPEAQLSGGVATGDRTGLVVQICGPTEGLPIRRMTRRCTGKYLP